MTRTQRRYLNSRMRRELGFNRGSANRWLNTRFITHLQANLGAAEPCRLAGQLTVRELRAILEISREASFFQRQISEADMEAMGRARFDEGMKKYLDAEVKG